MWCIWTLLATTCLAGATTSSGRSCTATTERSTGGAWIGGICSSPPLASGLEPFGAKASAPTKRLVPALTRRAFLDYTLQLTVVWWSSSSPTTTDQALLVSGNPAGGGGYTAWVAIHDDQRVRFVDSRPMPGGRLPSMGAHIVHCLRPYLPPRCALSFLVFLWRMQASKRCRATLRIPACRCCWLATTPLGSARSPGSAMPRRLSSPLEVPIAAPDLLRSLSLLPCNPTKNHHQPVLFHSIPSGHCPIFRGG